MALNKRDEGSKINSNINVTPMVDVMLVLLIIFMVITPMLQHGRNDHENDEQHQHHVHHGSDVDVGVDLPAFVAFR